jgi:CHAT domain-containing protein
MYPLAPGDQIRAAVAGFRDAVRDGRPESAELGERLYRALFGKLGKEEAGRRDWMIAADDALYEVPFAALVTERKASLKYLIEEHSLRLVPGAWSLAKERLAVAESRPAGAWLGVGDPIYNSADPRWSFRRRNWIWTTSASAGREFTRLVASAAEVESSARSWGANATVLEGAAATVEKFQAAVAHSPAVIHLATHVVAPSDRTGEALVVFGFDRSLKPQFLSTADIATMHVPGAIVAMTGCAAATGEIREGAGLLGLTRAWELAGAQAVIATLWPVSDSRGEIFESFYTRLRRLPVAEALRRSQVLMIHSGTWRAEPRYWASYQIFDQGETR